MSLTYAQVLHLYKEIQPFVLDAVCVNVLGISSRSFVLILEKNQSTYCLLLSFQEPFLRFHLCKNPVESTVKNPFVQQLSKNLVGKKIEGCVLLNEDRILMLSFQGKGSYRLVAEMLPKRPNCFLLDSANQIIATLNPVQAAIYSVPQKPEQRVEQSRGEISVPVTSLEISHHYDRLEADYVLIQQKKTASTDLEKEIKKAVKRVEDRTTILNACKNWHQVNHQGLLLQANLFRITKGMKEVIVSDWEQEGKEVAIDLDPLISPQNQIIAYFRRSKKLHAGERHAERLLKDAEKDLAVLLEQNTALNLVEDEEGLESYFKIYRPSFKALQKLPLIKKKEPAKPYYLYRSQAGIEIWVGKSAKDNDKLSFHYANGLDLWMHARNHPGSHVVVRCKKGQEPDVETLNDAAELALRYSKAKDQSQGEVCLTQVKGLTRVKGVPGKVMLSKHKVIHVVLDSKRFERLKGILF